MEPFPKHHDLHTKNDHYEITNIYNHTSETMVYCCVKVYVKWEGWAGMTLLEARPAYTRVQLQKGFYTRLSQRRRILAAAMPKREMMLHKVSALEIQQKGNGRKTNLPCSRHPSTTLLFPITSIYINMFWTTSVFVWGVGGGGWGGALQKPCVRAFHLPHPGCRNSSTLTVVDGKLGISAGARATAASAN
jgi:hypothetical protein